MFCWMFWRERALFVVPGQDADLRGQGEDEGQGKECQLHSGLLRSIFVRWLHGCPDVRPRTTGIGLG